MTLSPIRTAASLVCSVLLSAATSVHAAAPAPAPCGCGARTFDCNQNGIEDAVDIATGSSSDANGNGVPDECEHAAGR